MNLKSFVSILSLFFVFLACKTNYTVTETQKQRISISEDIPAADELVQIIAPYKHELDAKMNHVLAYNPIKLDKKGPNYPLGIFITDILLEESRLRYQKINPDGTIDAVLMNTGGLRRTFDPGNLSVRSMYELMPFENELVLVTLSSDQFVEMVNYLKNSDRNHPIAGFSFNKNQEVLNILVDGKPLDKDRNYNVVTNDYLQKGGDDMSFFQNPIKVEMFNIKIRDLMIEHLEPIDTIRVNTNPRYILN